MNAAYDSDSSEGLSSKRPLSEDPLPEDPLAEDPLAEDPLSEDPLSEHPFIEIEPFPVNVIRSTRRVKTVSARLVSGVLQIRIPSWMSQEEEDLVVAEFSDEMEKRKRCSHVPLAPRARTWLSGSGCPNLNQSDGRTVKLFAGVRALLAAVTSVYPVDWRKSRHGCSTT